MTIAFPSPMAESLFSGQMAALLVTGLIAGAYAIQKLAPKLGRRFLAAGQLQPLGFLTLTPQCSVAVVRVGRETLVLGLTPHTVTLLSRTPDHGTVATGEGNEATGAEEKGAVL